MDQIYIGKQSTIRLYGTAVPYVTLGFEIRL